MFGTLTLFYILTFYSVEMNYFPLSNFYEQLNYYDYIHGIKLIDAVPLWMWEIKGDEDDVPLNTYEGGVENYTFLYRKTVLSIEDEQMFKFILPSSSFMVSKGNGSYLGISPERDKRIYMGFSKKKTFYGLSFTGNNISIYFNSFHDDKIEKTHFFLKKKINRMNFLSIWGGNNERLKQKYSGFKWNYTDLCCKFNSYQFSSTFNFFGIGTTDTAATIVKFRLRNEFAYGNTLTITTSIAYTRHYFNPKNFIWNFSTFVEMRYFSSKTLLNIFMYHISKYTKSDPEFKGEKFRGVGSVIKISKQLKNFYLFTQENISYFYTPVRNETSHFYIETGFSKKIVNSGIFFTSVKGKMKSLKFQSGKNLFRGYGLITSLKFSAAELSSSFLLDEGFKLHDLKFKIVYKNQHMGIAFQSIFTKIEDLSANLSVWYIF